MGGELKRTAEASIGIGESVTKNSEGSRGSQPRS